MKKSYWKWSLMVIAVFAVSSLMVACGSDDKDNVGSNTNCSGANAYYNPACYGGTGIGGIPQAQVNKVVGNHTGNMILDGTNAGTALVNISYNVYEGFRVVISNNGASSITYCQALLDGLGNIIGLQPINYGDVSQTMLDNGIGNQWVMLGILAKGGNQSGLYSVDLVEVKYNEWLSGLLSWGWSSGDRGYITF